MSLMFLGISCDISNPTFDDDDTISGVFIYNSDADISHYSSDDTLTSNFYSGINGVKVGDEIISSSFYGTTGCILVNKDGKTGIEKIDMETFQSEDFNSPVENMTDIALMYDSIVFATSYDPAGGGKGYLNKIDLSTLEVLGTYEMGSNPSKVLYNEGKLVYVLNTDETENQLSIFDISRDSVVYNIALTDTTNFSTDEVLTKPVDMVVDAYNDLWVLCEGDGTDGAGLARITYLLNDVTAFPIDNFVGNGRNKLAVSAGGAVIYFASDAVYGVSIFDDTFTADSESKVFTDEYENMEFSAVDVSPSNGRFYCTSPTENKVYQFDAFGAIYESDSVLITPSSPLQCVFN